jgi:hypothetical protein
MYTHMTEEYICIEISFQYLTRFNIESCMLTNNPSKFWTHDKFDKYNLH